MRADLRRRVGTSCEARVENVLNDGKPQFGDVTWKTRRIKQRGAERDEGGSKPGSDAQKRNK